MLPKYFNIIVISTFILLLGCSSTARFSRDENEYKSTDKNSTPHKKEEIKKDYSGKIIFEHLNKPLSNPIKVNRKDIRVLLESTAKYILYPQNKVTVKNDEQIIADNKDISTMTFVNEDNKIEADIDGEKYSFSNVDILPASDDSLVMFNNTIYRGGIRVSADKDKIDIINILNIEDYIKGVIPGEMPTGKKDELYEAVKAFTIIARTFAYNKISQDRALFDVHRDVRSQVYVGYKKERPIANKAVKETEGEVLSYNDMLATVFYSSTCGGYTEDAEFVFGVKNMPYLQGVPDGSEDEPFCKISPIFKWEEKFTESEFISRLKKAGLLNGGHSYSISDIEKSEIDASGRIKKLSITLNNSQGSEEVILKGGKIRSVITSRNNDILKSSNFNISLDGDIITLKGTGYGHGVGLCQYGAIGMCKSGANYQDILFHYFPGTSISKIL